MHVVLELSIPSVKICLFYSGCCKTEVRAFDNDLPITSFVGSSIELYYTRQKKASAKEEMVTRHIGSEILPIFSPLSALKAEVSHS